MKLPPYAEALELRIEDNGGERHVVMPAGDHLLGRPGFVHGGALAGLLEIAAIVALRALLAEEQAPRLKPVTVTVDFRRGAAMVETRAIGLVTRLGNRVANIDALAWQEDRAKPVASARMNVLIDRGAR